jgi:glycerol uptake facilitator-like aquaporin
MSIFSMKKCVAEFVGTFALVFAGTGAIIINERAAVRLLRWESRLHSV